MAHPQETRAEVRRLYTVEQKSLPEAAQEAGVPLATARQWKARDKAAGEDWDKLKTAYIMAGGKMEDVNRAIMASFLVRYQEAMEDADKWDALDPLEKVDALTRLSDSYTKTVAANRKMLPEISELAVAMETIKTFGDFIRETRPAVAMDFIELIEMFAPELQRRFSK